MESKIKYGVTLYSYQDEYFRRDMTVRDCIEAVADMGATGIEILPDEMIPNWMNVSDEWLDNWFGWLDEFGCEPVAIDAFCDEKGLWKKIGRPYCLEDGLKVQRAYVDIAAKLGCKFVKTMINDMDLLREMIPYAEDKNVKLAIEIHAPGHVKDEKVTNWLDMIEKTGSKYLGFVPDFGIYEQQPTPIIMRQNYRDGCSQEIAEEAMEKKKLGWTHAQCAEYFKAKGANPGDMAGVWRVFNVSPDDPEDLKIVLPYIFGMHGKFWNMTDEMLEESVDYYNPMRVLIEGGYDGYIFSEYEGGRHMQDIGEVRGVEQTRRHHLMMRNMAKRICEELG